MPNSVDPVWQMLGLLTAYSFAVILASVVGGMLPEWVKLTHNRMQLMISLVGGLMLGIAIFHMIPHALVAAEGRIDQVMQGVMLGLVATFFLIRCFHFHQHGPADFGIQAEAEAATRAALVDDHQADQQTHICSEHVHPAPCDHAGRQHADHRQGTTRWIAVLVGLALHTLMDGVAMASGVVTEAGHTAIPGLGIFLAVLLHKPLDAVSITSLMHPVTTPSKRLLVNVGFALMCPLGAFLFWAGATSDNAFAQQLAAWGLAFSAGVFLCISLSDLLPEMEFHSHSRIPLSIALLLGIALAWAIGLLEGEHAHSHDAHSGGHVHEEHDHAHEHGTPQPSDNHAGHDHAGHSH